ncbi:pyrroline-5-carboxylate reductase [Novosphingobium sp. JCM 18896]|uniref:pyrroline-5-carboxylate reductase n=1 Tax=Novosphingobium sp. JCM 18896 TaxID=2989731 RepID=UPI002223E23F|nr:pyrroline-5-carboxylate reductase [Novosphingobium sp. JCM 18896]MCW1430534.1 pyrroline-5-carboxylate reductase [Novosphingobium sp. JCM 18896]
MLDTILIIGCGNMGGAMLAGWLASGIAPSRFTVVDPVLAEAPQGVTLLRDLPQGARFDLVMLGIKPQMLADLAPTIAPFVGAETTLLSILAGAEVATLARLFPEAGGRVRIMPNLSAAIGKSPIALATQDLDADRQAAVTALMDPLGTPEWLPEEQFDIVTALAGSGPAFVYRFIDALAAGATALGLDAGQAQRLALATVEGASLLAAASEHSPGELARRVASPGGTTQAGLDVLDADGALAKLAQATLKAAADRNAEMAKAICG